MLTLETPMYFDQRKYLSGAISTPWFYSNISQTTAQLCAALFELVSIPQSSAQLRNLPSFACPQLRTAAPNYEPLPLSPVQLRNAASVACPTTQRCPCHLPNYAMLPLSPAQLRNAAPCRLPNYATLPPVVRPTSVLFFSGCRIIYQQNDTILRRRRCCCCCRLLFCSSSE